MRITIQPKHPNYDIGAPFDPGAEMETVIEGAPKFGHRWLAQVFASPVTPYTYFIRCKRCAVEYHAGAPYVSARPGEMKYALGPRFIRDGEPTGHECHGAPPAK